MVSNIIICLNSINRRSDKVQIDPPIRRVELHQNNFANVIIHFIYSSNTLGHMRLIVVLVAETFILMSITFSKLELQLY
uniref:Uncharacterized protein n=1 Tax=Pararge aegeria TaxID=116150 RepID=S4PM41_9NEOP